MSVNCNMQILKCFPKKKKKIKKKILHASHPKSRDFNLPMVNRTQERLICHFVLVLQIQRETPHFDFTDIRGCECRADLLTQGERSP